MPLSQAHPPGAVDPVAVVRAMYTAYGALSRERRVAEYVVNHFDPECEYLPIEEAGPIRGHRALGDWLDRWLDAWDEAWDDVHEVVEVGGKLISSITVHARGRRSGIRISQRIFDVFELCDGKIVRISEHLHHCDALAAAG